MNASQTRLARYQKWLKNRSQPAPDIMTGIGKTVGELALDREGLQKRGWTDLPIEFVPEAGQLLVGGYLEERAIYNSPVFAGDGHEARTLHLGLDIFAPAETGVFAPLEGHVHSFQVNNGELDYGPTLILEHQPEDGLTFWTLYGHLSEDSLLGLEDGDPITAGEKIAELGASDVNGGWAPHLHFQIMLDIQGRRGDFPGVCRKSEIEAWKLICPDPAQLLGLSTNE
ncbi:MAG: peptidase M23 [Ponticaulis sp.]|nr:peptidase M23 [Ponticaulis sp.]